MRLRNRLEQLWEEARAIGEQRTAAGVPGDDGLCIEFVGEPEYSLAVESLENLQQGIQLLRVVERDGLVSATVFVPHGKISYFLRRIDAYLSEETRTGAPKNNKLVAGINDIRQATLRAFWADSDELWPDEGEEVLWEVWLRAPRADEGTPMLERFRLQAEDAGVTVLRALLTFPDRTVILARASAEVLAEAADLLDCMAELRLAHMPSSAPMRLGDVDLAQQIGELIEQTTPANASAPAVCLLDTGVTAAHPLLRPSLADSDCHAYNPEWGTTDHAGHGTALAGLSLLGDLRDKLGNGPHELRHRLESVKILPPRGFPRNEERLYGEVTRTAVSRAVITAPERPRVICLAASVHPDRRVLPDDDASRAEWEDGVRRISDSRGFGQPSSWSAALDQIATGEELDDPQLLVVAAGNTELPCRRFYPDLNYLESVHDPAQAWNILSVGGYSRRATLDATQYPEWQVIAPAGGMAPSNTTSTLWYREWPHKPDIVADAGNLAREPGQVLPCAVDELESFTTDWRAPHRLITTAGDSSAASALVAGMAAELLAEYPGFWPETIRGLLIHSADWTEEMLGGRDPFGMSSAEKESLLRSVGYGVPSLERALYSASDDLTLVVQDGLQPYKRSESRYVFNEMAFHYLPWPEDELRQLGDHEVTLTVTLSYFIEPSPGARGWDRKYRYSSHGLRFQVRTATETQEEFRRRINLAARTEPDEATTDGDSAEWLLGQHLRTRGSVHKDVWRGTAADLADRGLVGIIPRVGWWRERHHLGRWGKRARYALIISINTQESDVDIYTPVQVAIRTPVEIEL